MSLLVLAGCSDRTLPPAGQVLLFIDTDAPLPAAPGAPPREAPPLFDRLRLDVIPDGASTPCGNCTRIFSLDHDTVFAGAASVGIVPEPGERPVVRVRLYWSGGTASGEPRPRSSIDRYVRLPAVAETDIVEATVFLPTVEVGQTQGRPDAPLEVSEGATAGGRAGTWPAPAAPCQPDGDRVCVPGGAFWMGDPRLDLSAAFDTDGELERLVVLSTFYVDATEVTVGALRAADVARLIGGVSDDPAVPENIAGCTYSTDAGEREGLPVNCVSWFTAHAHCTAVGGQLPSEAQLEYLRGGLGRSRYVWGDAEPRCPDAVFAANSTCSDTWPGGPLPAGSAALDRLTLPDGEVVDLAGNLSERAADRWARETEPCWLAPLVFDPRCEQASAIDPPGRSFRGGTWSSNDTVAMQAAVRQRLANEVFAVSASLGFRCAYPAGR